ncbi:MAG: hypothetical protein GY715_03180 [Planctomycetes bacterium]|nr:hypothetical protein [Planctomycetota bacterium]
MNVMHRTRLLAAALFVILLAPVVRAADAPATQASTRRLLDRVAVVGASASSGFGARVDLQRGATVTRSKADFATVLDALLTPEHERVTGHASMLFFRNPTKAGPSLLGKALQTEPTLVVGVDFLFWFGYGHGSRSHPVRSESQRLEFLEVGLTLLEEVRCPLIVGDFPDMSPAIGLMLSRSQVPNTETLDALNERLRSWAASRPNVVVLPLADLLERMRSDHAFTVGGHRWPEGSATKLMQRDQLHPTALGLIALAQSVGDELARFAPTVVEGAFEVDPDRVMERVREALLERNRARVGAREEAPTP